MERLREKTGNGQRKKIDTEGREGGVKEQAVKMYWVRLAKNGTKTWEGGWPREAWGHELDTAGGREDYFGDGEGGHYMWKVHP